MEYELTKSPPVALPSPKASANGTNCQPIITPANDTPSHIDVIMNESISMSPSNDTASISHAKTQTYVAPSSQDHGLPRLLPEGVMELKADDEVVLVIPIDRRGEGSNVKINRAAVKDSLKKES